MNFDLLTHLLKPTTYKNWFQNCYHIPQWETNLPIRIYYILTIILFCKDFNTMKYTKQNFEGYSLTLDTCSTHTSNKIKNSSIISESFFIFLQPFILIFHHTWSCLSSIFINMEQQSMLIFKKWLMCNLHAIFY